MSETETFDAMRRLGETLKPFTQGEPDLMDAQEACLALEALERVVGHSSMTLARLRRELKKRGLKGESHNDA